MTTIPTGAFIAIGENVHASRTCARRGASMALVDGQEVLRFTDAAGAERTCPLAAPVAQSLEFSRQRVKHIKNALLLGMAGDRLLPAGRVDRATPEAADAGRAYLVAAAVRQQRAGARYIDVNVDDIDEDLGIRREAMAWLVRLLEPELDVPLSLDSPSPEVLEAGLRASSGASGPVLLNSASGERMEVLDMAVGLGAAVVLSAVRQGGAAPGIDERVACADAMLEAARTSGLAAGDCYIDMLVLPAGLDCDAGSNFLGASRAFRAGRAQGVHLTGGLSNISFGLPNRRLLNDTFVALAMDAGVDSGILDPVTVRLGGIGALDREAARFRLAEAVILGADHFARAYLAAHRAGALAEPSGVGAAAGASLSVQREERRH